MMQERRLVTVLFADFVGFTSLADVLDPEVLQELFSGIFEDLAEEAIGYDGTIEKFVGDAIFVIFGAPMAHEDDPQRALRTALAMHRVFAEHATRAKKEHGVELGLRIGVNTGMVVAGHVRSVAEYGVMGDTVNVASRLQAEAAAGETYVTQATFRLCNRDFSFREVGPIDIKGKELPVLAYALTGERTEKRVAIELKAPLVGRWMELSRLDLAFQSARVGRTEVVIVSGEPGIGKSRLINEFIGLAAASEDGAEGDDVPRTLRWTFSRVNQRSYAGFIEPLLVELEIDPSAPDAHERLERKLADLRFADPPRAAAMLAQFLHLPGVPEQESESDEWKRQMYLIVYDVISSLARERPLIYVLEDVHYADSASVDLLWSIAQRSARVPILFLLAQRLDQGAPELRPTRTNLTQIVLDPLAVDEAARIIESTLEAVPAEVRDRIVARAGGNPFFIEESLRSLVESGAVARDADGEWQMRERPAALQVPATLHAVVASRVDHLPPVARECIQLASVIGQRFGDRVLRAAGGDRLGDAVDILIAADLVVDAAPGERREGRYRFKHAVTQEVAYNTLLVRRRVELHRQVAAAFEDVMGDQIKDFYPALAHHYLLGEVPEKAAKYAWKAAQRSMSIHAHVEALRSVEQALELYEKLGDTARAVEALYLVARIRRFRGEFDAALAAYERALALLEARDPNSFEVASLYAHMSELCTRWDAKHPDLSGLISRGLALIGDARSRERVLLLAARAFAVRKAPRPTDADWHAAIATAEEALAIAEDLGLIREASLCLDAIGYAKRELGLFEDALHLNERRVPMARSLQDNDELIDAHTMVAESAIVLGDLAQAEEHASTARELALSTEKPRLGIQALVAEATAHLIAGEFHAAIAAADALERFAVTPAMARLGQQTLVVAAAAAAALGTVDPGIYRDRLLETEPAPGITAWADFLTAVYAHRESESSYLALRSSGIPNRIVGRTIYGPVMVVAAARWRVDDDAHDERVAALVERTGYARGRALLAQAQGLRASARGEHARAEKLLFDAVQALATLRLDHDRAAALLDHARALLALGRRGEAEAELDDVRRTAERLGASALAVAAELQTVPA